MAILCRKLRKSECALYEQWIDWSGVGFCAPNYTNCAGSTVKFGEEAKDGAHLRVCFGCIVSLFKSERILIRLLTWNSVCIAGIIRLTTLYKATLDPDISWHAVGTVNWSQ